MMMDIDWDNAPEGATHYDRKTGVWCDDAGYFDFSGDYHFIVSPTHDGWGTSRYVKAPRPAKPAAPEWDGNGLPPVGCECEYEALYDWWSVKITAVGDKHILMNYGGVEICRCMKDSRFRPIRPKEQMERDELIEIILTDGDLSAGMLADVIINAGYRKPEND